MRLANIQIDLDGSWALSQYLDKPIPKYPDAIFQNAFPRFLDILDEFEVKATCFVNAVDVTIPEKKAIIVESIKRGHEIANHGYDHKYFSSLNLKGNEEEIKKSMDILNDLVG